MLIASAVVPFESPAMYAPLAVASVLTLFFVPAGYFLLFRSAKGA
jgi:hypothetical protein